MVESCLSAETIRSSMMGTEHLQSLTATGKAISSHTVGHWPTIDLCSFSVWSEAALLQDLKHDACVLTR